MLDKLQLTVSWERRRSWPSFHHVTVGGGRDPAVWHVNSYLGSVTIEIFTLPHFLFYFKGNNTKIEITIKIDIKKKKTKKDLLFARWERLTTAQYTHVQRFDCMKKKNKQKKKIWISSIGKWDINKEQLCDVVSHQTNWYDWRGRS